MKKFSCNRATAFFLIIIYWYIDIYVCTIFARFRSICPKTYFLAFCAWFYISYENRARIVQCTIYWYSIYYNNINHQIVRLHENPPFFFKGCCNGLHDSFGSRSIFSRLFFVMRPSWYRRIFIPVTCPRLISWCAPSITSGTPLWPTRGSMKWLPEACVLLWACGRSPGNTNS